MPWKNQKQPGKPVVKAKEYDLDNVNDFNEEDDIPKTWKRIMQARDRVFNRQEKMEKTDKSIKDVKKESKKDNKSFTAKKSEYDYSEVTEAIKNVKKLSTKRKEKLNQRKAKKKNRKEEKEEEYAKDTVKFGEVVQAPPNIKKSKKLTQIKNKAISLRQEESLEEERKRVVDAYRLLRKKNKLD